MSMFAATLEDAIKHLARLAMELGLEGEIKAGSGSPGRIQGLTFELDRGKGARPAPLGWHVNMAEEELRRLAGRPQRGRLARKPTAAEKPKRKRRKAGSKGPTGDPA